MVEDLLKQFSDGVDVTTVVHCTLAHHLRSHEFLHATAIELTGVTHRQVMGTDMEQQDSIITLAQENSLGRIADTKDSLLVQIAYCLQQLSGKVLYEVWLGNDGGSVIQYLPQRLVLSLLHFQAHDIISFHDRTEMQDMLVGELRVLLTLCLQSLTELDVTIQFWSDIHHTAEFTIYLLTVVFSNR